MFGLIGIIAGIITVIIGGLFIFMLQSADSYQPDSFSLVFALAGIIMAIVGVLLIFW